MDINTVSLSGRLARDPEYIETQGGLGILKFTLANSRRFKKDGEWQSVSQYFDCVIFGKIATSLSTKLMKSTQVVVSGSLHYESWEDKNTGLKRNKINITVDNLNMFNNNIKTGLDAVSSVFDVESVV